MRLEARGFSSLRFKVTARARSNAQGEDVGGSGVRGVRHVMIRSTAVRTARDGKGHLNLYGVEAHS